MNKAISNQEILTKAIKKAIAGGWTAELSAKDEITIYGLLIEEQSYRSLTVEVTAEESRIKLDDWYPIIFNHGFAKALWGESKSMTMQEVKAAGYSGFGGGTLHDIDWKYHLQQMVIADNPIKYLGEHLDG